jgi:hypothetical protein
MHFFFLFSTKSFFKKIIYFENTFQRLARTKKSPKAKNNRQRDYGNGE